MNKGIKQLAILTALLLMMPGVKAQIRNQEGHQDQIQTLKTETTASVDLNAYIYPNPCAGDVRVYYNNEGQSQVEVKLTDVMGNLVSEHTYINISAGLNTFEYDLSDLPAGDYYVKVSNDAGSKTLKLLKQ